MRMLVVSLAVLTFAVALPARAAQRPDSLGAHVREYVTVDTAVLALTHVLVIDGTGAAPRPDQTVVIRDGKIAEVGPAQAVRVPAGVRTMDLAGSTVIPGIVGMHDHLFYTAAGGRFAQMSYTGPRLYLAAGVTTIRTTGSRSPYNEINLKDQIDHGLEPGPRIHITAPYITGPQGGAMMAVLKSPEAARRFVAYWAAEGATWIKAYTDIRRAELGAAIAEAHRQGIKVTGHLCSVTLQEAVALGIDNLEHGMFAASDFDTTKTPDVCPAGLLTHVNDFQPQGAVGQATIRTLVSHHVSMTSTLAVVEPFIANRPTKDARVLQAMAPEVRESYLKVRQQIDSTGQGPISLQGLRNAMAFERAFVA
ncbi:MAG TPA: amidohydrolase family protein, partial [Candidatus Dormibacteraeota bacterium]|nr:amidohydrolase family protein [Candidatus Dormibacteraeota bacterium]